MLLEEYSERDRDSTGPDGNGISGSDIDIGEAGTHQDLASTRASGK